MLLGKMARKIFWVAPLESNVLFISAIVESLWRTEKNGESRSYAARYDQVLEPFRGLDGVGSDKRS